jgi:predicted metalloendopeptidase
MTVSYHHIMTHILLFASIIMSYTIDCRYPDKWIDYTPLKIEEGESFLEMEFKAREFESSLDIEQMNAPTDKSKWVCDGLRETK